MCHLHSHNMVAPEAVQDLVNNYQSYYVDCLGKLHCTQSLLAWILYMKAPQSFEGNNIFTITVKFLAC